MANNELTNESVAAINSEKSPGEKAILALAELHQTRKTSESHLLFTIASMLQTDSEIYLPGYLVSSPDAYRGSLTWPEAQNSPYLRYLKKIAYDSAIEDTDPSVTDLFELILTDYKLPEPIYHDEKSLLLLLQAVDNPFQRFELHLQLWEHGNLENWQALAKSADEMVSELLDTYNPDLAVLDISVLYPDVDWALDRMLRWSNAETTDNVRNIKMPTSV